MAIRLRLTLLMVCGAAVLVAVASTALALSLEGGAQATLKQVLLQRAQRVVMALKAGDLAVAGRPVPVVAQIDQTVVQVVDANAAVRYTTDLAGHTSLLSESTLRSAELGPVWVELRRKQWTSPRLILASPAGTGALVVVVGTSLDQIDDMMRRVVLALLLGGPLLVVVTAIGVWRLTGAALAPVERLRAEAAAISVADLGRRLEVPGTHDELTALAETLNHLLDELDSAIRRQRHFVAAAGHELRTPLARMRTELDLALRPGRSSDDLRTRLTGALAGVDRVSRVISELLVLARDDEGHLLVRPELRDLGGLVAAGLLSFRARAQVAHVPLVFNLEPGVMVEVDELWFRHALDNLLDNALRYSPPGSSLEVLVRAADGDAVVEVGDQGPGFPPGLVPQRWERFGAGPMGAPANAQSTWGNGLGLWIVGMIMTAHHGHAQIANRPGGGAAVSLHLPRAVVDPTFLPDGEKSEPGAAPIAS